MLRGSDDPVLVIARSSIVSSARKDHLDPTHIMFSDQLLGDALEVSLAHPLESIPNVLLHEFFRVWYHLSSIVDPIFSRIPVSSGL